MKWGLQSETEPKPIKTGLSVGSKTKNESKTIIFKGTEPKYLITVENWVGKITGTKSFTFTNTV